MRDWRSAVLAPTTLLQHAIELSQHGEFSLVLVIEENGRLLGTISDDDIRRALMRYRSLAIPVTDVMFPGFVRARVGDSVTKMAWIMKEKEISLLPVVDEKGCIVDVVSEESSSQSRELHNPVVLMAGGLGSRLGTLTADIPKPMLQIEHKPILETIVEQFKEAGFGDIFISTYYMARVIEDYFGNGSQWGLRIRYLHESMPLGTAGALGLLPQDIPDLPILVMNADVLARVPFQALLSHHKKSGSLVTMCIREHGYRIPYGIVKTSDARVISITEKPEQKILVNAGIYVLDKSVVRSVEVGGRLDMPTLLARVIEAEQGISSFPLYESWLDIGDPKDYRKAKTERGCQMEMSP